jgi:hypothetical protein
LGSDTASHARVAEVVAVLLAAVVKVQVKLDDRGLPAASFAAVDIVAVYCVLAVSAAEGTKVVLFPVVLTVPVTAAFPAVFTSVKLAVLSVEFVMASEKVADTDEFNATPTAKLAGETADTVGGVASTIPAVVNVQETLAARAIPVASFAAVVIVAVYCVPATRLFVGLNSAVFPLTVTVPATGVPPDVVARRKLAAVRVEFVIASENVAETELFNATSFPAFAGIVEMTCGGVLLVVDAVVKIQMKLEPRALPAESFTAVVIVALYSVFAARFAEGVNLAPAALTLTVPLTTEPSEDLTRVKDDVVKEALLMALEN